MFLIQNLKNIKTFCSKNTKPKLLDKKEEEFLVFMTKKCSDKNIKIKKAFPI